MNDFKNLDWPWRDWWAIHSMAICFFLLDFIMWVGQGQYRFIFGGVSLLIWVPMWWSTRWHVFYDGPWSREE